MCTDWSKESKLLFEIYVTLFNLYNFFKNWIIFPKILWLFNIPTRMSAKDNLALFFHFVSFFIRSISSICEGLRHVISWKWLETKIKLSVKCLKKKFHLILCNNSILFSLIEHIVWIYFVVKKISWKFLRHFYHDLDSFSLSFCFLLTFTKN